MKDILLSPIQEGTTKEFLSDINSNFQTIYETFLDIPTIYSGTEDPTKNTALTNSQNGDIYIQYATK